MQESGRVDSWLHDLSPWPRYGDTLRPYQKVEGGEVAAHCTCLHRSPQSLVVLRIRPVGPFSGGLGRTEPVRRARLRISSSTVMVRFILAAPIRTRHQRNTASVFVDERPEHHRRTQRRHGQNTPGAWLARPRPARHADGCAKSARIRRTAARAFRWSPAPIHAAIDVPEDCRAGTAPRTCVSAGNGVAGVSRAPVPTVLPPA